MTNDSVELRGEPDDKDYEAEIMASDVDRVARIELHIAHVEESTLAMRNILAGILALLIFMGLVYVSLILYVLFFAPHTMTGGI